MYETGRIYHQMRCSGIWVYWEILWQMSYHNGMDQFNKEECIVAVMMLSISCALIISVCAQVLAKIVCEIYVNCGLTVFTITEI